jgi:hypothetical protein
MRYYCSPDDDFDFDTDDFDSEDDDSFDEDEQQEDDEESDEAESNEDSYAGDFNEEDLPEIDNDVYASAEDFPNAADVDFEDDEGGWSLDDYQNSAENIFGEHPFFGDTLDSKLADEGYQPFTDPSFERAFEDLAPGSTQTLTLYERAGKLFAHGYLPMALLSILQSRYSGIDFSNLAVSVPPIGERTPPQPLPAAFESIQPADAVDLRKYATPVSDQKQTSRCAAFAWTHANEMAHNIINGEAPRLSNNYTMLQFQQMQGDAKSFRYAYQGGDGTVPGPEPGQVLAQEGTCRQMLWPDDSPQPLVDEQQMAADADRHRLPAKPWPIHLDDAKKVLTAGCPIQLSMSTGPRFSQVGRDGLVDVAEDPSGTHGRHAMLLCGYTGNFYIVKNSWGSQWGDKGYCYIPKNVLAASEPDLVAVLLDKKESK